MKITEKSEEDVSIGIPPILKLNLTKAKFKGKNSPKLYKNEKLFSPAGKTKNGGKKIGSNVRKITQFFENIQKRAEVKKTDDASKQPYPTYKLASSMWRGGIISGHGGGWLKKFWTEF